MSSNNLTIAIPVPIPYGAVELKEFIKRNTLRSFIITTIVVALLLIISIAMSLTNEITTNKEIQLPHTSTIIIDNPPTADIDVPNVVIPPDISQVVFGIERVAGNPVPVQDAEITQELDEFVTYDNITSATSHVGNVDPETVPNFKVENLQNHTIVAPVDEIPPSTIFKPVEKEPVVDLAELQKNVEYPAMARQIGLEGKAIIRVYVDMYGKPQRTEVQMSAGEMLNKAANDAIMKTTFTPAIQNKQPIGCWVSIPINFKLR